MRPFLLLALLPSLLFAAEPPARWWKGNLHTHTLWSDGDEYPEMVAQWYKDQGYHFLALSDHNIIADHERWIPIIRKNTGQEAFDKYQKRFGEKWVEQRTTADGTGEVRLKMLSEFRPLVEEPERFLMIVSEEITSRYLTAPIHINATNVRELIPPQDGTSVVDVMQKTVNLVAEQRQRTGVPMFPHINHPNYGWALTAEELMQLENERFFEVYNGHPLVNNDGDATHASTDRIWDILLTERLAVLHKPPFFGLATDDSHQYHNEPKKLSHPGRGWIMVRSKKLGAEDLIAALEAGDFYASSGVTLNEVKREKKTLSLEIAAEPGVTYTTEFFGTRRGYDRTSEPVTDESGTTLRTTRRYSKDIGTVLATVTGPSASYELKGDELYVRARVTSTKLKADPYREGEFERAWTQPLVPAAE